MPEQDVSAHAAIICERIKTEASMSDRDREIMTGFVGLIEIAVGSLVRIANALEAK